MLNRREFMVRTGVGSLVVTMSGAGALAKAQVSAVQRFKIGEVTVSALSDGFIPMNDSLFSAVNADQFKSALNDAFLDPTGYQAAINAYVIDDGKNVRLVDAGGGAMMPSVGNLPKNLKAAGYKPEDISSLIVTHLHPDHIGGAAGPAGALFTNAEMVVSSIDHGFWTNPEIKAGAPDQAKPFFDMAVGAVSAYGDRLRLFEGEAEVVPGLIARPLPGHTPGHTGFVLTSGSDSLLIWGDIIHMPPLQLADPTISIAFDIDATTAVATRANVMDQVATDRLMVAGMHLSFPGVGYLEKDGPSGFNFIPATWQYN